MGLTYHAIDNNFAEFEFLNIFQYVSSLMDGNKDSVYIIYNPSFSTHGKTFGVSRFDIISHYDLLPNYNEVEFFRTILGVSYDVVKMKHCNDKGVDYSLSTKRELRNKVGLYRYSNLYFHLKDMGMFPEQIQEQLLMRLNIL